MATTERPRRRPARRRSRRTRGRRQHVVILSRAVGRRQDGGDEAVRGPRLHLRRQPARRAAARPRRARSPATRSGSSGSRSCWTSGPATPPWPSPRCAARSRAAGSGPQVFFLEARDEVLIRRFSETRHRHPLGGLGGDRGLDRRGAPPAGAGPGRGRRRARHVGPVAARAPRADLHAALARRRARTSSRSSSISFGFKYGVPLEADLVFDVRFMQNPYYVPELRRLSGLTEGVRDVRPRPAARAPLPRRRPGVPRPRRPGLRRRGQDAPDDRDRLHRRLPPLDRDRRGDRGLARERGLRRRSASSTASWSGGEPA